MTGSKYVAFGVFLISSLFLLGGTDVQGVENRLSDRDIDWCDENFKYFEQLGERKFLEVQRWSLKARVCIHLYKDPIWSYEGKVRTERLASRSTFYMDQEIERSKKQAEVGVANPGITPEAKEKTSDQRIFDLEKKVKELEMVIAKKDALLEEQSDSCGDQATP